MMVALAVISVATIWYKTSFNQTIIWTIWGIFFIDFFFKMFKSENKLTFIKQNPFLLIAIIPLDALFQFARFARIIHLFRLKTITRHYTEPLLKKLKNKKLSFLFPLTFAILFLSVIPLYYLEPTIETFKDAFLSSIISLIFFGSISIEPASHIGKGIIIVMSIFGVLLHGLLISYLFDIISNFKLFKKIKSYFSKK